MNTNHDEMSAVIGRAASAQSLPEGNWTLVEGSKGTGDLVYFDDAGGYALRVPNIWYNQPVSWNIEYMEFCARRAEEAAQRLIAESGTSVVPLSDLDARHRLQSLARQSVECRDLIQRMIETGRPLRNEGSYSAPIGDEAVPAAEAMEPAPAL